MRKTLDRVLLERALRELASPSGFIPEFPGWRERSIPIDTFGHASFFHYDFYSQALAKLERGHDRDLHDVEKMCEDGLVDRSRLLEHFEAIVPALLKYPSLDEDGFRERISQFVASGGEDT